MFFKREVPTLPVLNFSKIPAIYIIGEDNHFSTKNAIFKDRLKQLVRQQKNNFFLCLEGEPFPDDLDTAKKFNASGIQNKIITYYTECVAAYIFMNSENSHSDTMKPKIEHHVFVCFLRLCQFIPKFWNYNHDQDKNMREILFGLSCRGIHCRDFFLNMPGEYLLDHCDSMADPFYFEEWLEKHGSYLLDNIPAFSNVLKEITLALRDFILNKMSGFIEHPALSEEIIQLVFSHKHHFEENEESTTLMRLFLVDLKNDDWKKNIVCIGGYALARGLPVICIVGDDHIEGLKHSLGQRFGEYRINYYSSHDIQNSPLCFMDDMSLTESSEFSSKIKRSLV